MSMRWARMWMKIAGQGWIRPLATRLAALGMPRYKGRTSLARLHLDGYRAPNAVISHPALETGRHVFIGERVTIYAARGAGQVRIGERSCVHQDTVIETGDGGSLVIGTRSHIQPRCQFSAYKGKITVGDDVQIAPQCGFYPYNHGVSTGIPIIDQPLSSNGGISIEDDAWIGFGVVVLDNVRIGHGAIIGAGSVVTKDIPPGAIAAGVPARVLKMRDAVCQDPK